MSSVCIASGQGQQLFRIECIECSGKITGLVKTRLRVSDLRRGSPQSSVALANQPRPPSPRRVSRCALPRSAREAVFCCRQALPSSTDPRESAGCYATVTAVEVTHHARLLTFGWNGQGPNFPCVTVLPSGPARVCPRRRCGQYSPQIHPPRESRRQRAGALDAIDARVGRGTTRALQVL